MLLNVITYWMTPFIGVFTKWSLMNMISYYNELVIQNLYISVTVGPFLSVCNPGLDKVWPAGHMLHAKHLYVALELRLKLPE